jgi:hypothetical protein
MAIGLMVGSLALGAAVIGQRVGVAGPPQPIAGTRAITIHVVDSQEKPIQGVRVFRNHV